MGIVDGRAGRWVVIVGPATSDCGRVDDMTAFQPGTVMSGRE
jgi:hypothetical protein